MSQNLQSLEANVSGEHETAPPTTEDLGPSSTSYVCLNKLRIFKIIVVGDSNVGKTCLTYRFCQDKFPERSDATIGVEFREKNVKVGGEWLKLQIWDTAGQERFRKSMVSHYYRNVHAVVFVYDVTKLLTFESLPDWIAECDRHNLSPDVPRILVGNKCDLHDEIKISTNDAQRYADLHRMPLFETSAKDSNSSDHVESIFLTIAHKLKNCRSMSMPAMSSSTGQFYHASSSRRELEDDVSSPVSLHQSRYDSVPQHPPSTCLC